MSQDVHWHRTASTFTVLPNPHFSLAVLEEVYIFSTVRMHVHPAEYRHPRNNFDRLDILCSSCFYEPCMASNIECTFMHCSCSTMSRYYFPSLYSTLHLLNVTRKLIKPTFKTTLQDSVPTSSPSLITSRAMTSLSFKRPSTLIRSGCSRAASVRNVRLDTLHRSHAAVFLVH